MVAEAQEAEVAKAQVEVAQEVVVEVIKVAEAQVEEAQEVEVIKAETGPTRLVVEEEISKEGKADLEGGIKEDSRLHKVEEAPPQVDKTQANPMTYAGIREAT